MILVLAEDIEAEAHRVGFHGLGSVGQIFEDRVFVFQRRIRVSSRNVSIVEVEVRKPPSPRQGTRVSARDPKLLSHSLIGGSREQQLMRLRDAESGVNQKRRTYGVGCGSRYRERGAVLQVIAGARRREAARSTQERP